MARVKIKVERGNGLQQVVTVDTDATKGARLGRDVYMPDGTVATPASMRSWMGVSQGTAAAPTAGSSLQSVLTHKGDLATRGSQVQRLGIGTQDQVLRVSASGMPEWRSGAALTKQDDTNVTLTLGGNHATALLGAASIAVGWSGTLAQDRGGWGADISAANGYAKFTAGVAAFSNTVPWGDVSSTPTTLGGYGITDAYTDAEVDTLLTAYTPTSGLAPVALSNDYGDLDNLPTLFDGDWGSLANIPAIVDALAGLPNASGVLTNDGSGNLSWGAGSSAAAWGSITGTLSDQTDLQSALDGKQASSSVLTAYAGGNTPSAFTLGIVDAVDAAAWRTAIGAGTSSLTIGGSNGQIQFNNSGSLDGSSGLTWNAGTATLTSTNIAGNGSNITALNADNITTGTVADARLSSNVALKNASNTWTGSNTFTLGKDSSADGALLLASAFPAQKFRETDQAADEKDWNFLLNSKLFSIATENDAATDGRYALRIQRGTGVAVSEMIYGNSSDNPSHTFHGTLNTAGNIFLNNNPVPCIVSGGAAGGGRITISTSAPSGTPADGDIWIQHAP